MCFGAYGGTCVVHATRDVFVAGAAGAVVARCVFLLLRYFYIVFTNDNCPIQYTSRLIDFTGTCFPKYFQHWTWRTRTLSTRMWRTCNSGEFCDFPSFTSLYQYCCTKYCCTNTVVPILLYHYCCTKYCCTNTVVLFTVHMD